MLEFILSKLVDFDLIKVISEKKIQKTHHSVQKITPEEEKLYEDIIHDLKCDDFLEKFPTLEHFIVSYNLGLESTPRCVCGKPCKISYCNYTYLKSCGDKECSGQTRKLTFKETYRLYGQEIKEKSLKTNLEKYGTAFYTQTEEYKKQRKETNLKKYGTEWPTQSQVVKDKTAKTCLEKYGVNSTLKVKEFREKGEQTFKEKHNGMTPSEYFSSSEAIEKVRKTCNEKYGYDNPAQVPKFQEKAKQTCLERYGKDNYFKTEEFQEKSKKTCLEKYGVEHILQDPQHFEKIYTYYKYNDLGFDSSSELAFYIYHTEALHENVERLPLRISYINDYNNKEHYYYPDFRIGDQLIEIKGVHLIDKITGIWIPSPQDYKDCVTEEDIKTIERKLVCKYQCAINNNVKIIKNKDPEIKEAEKWVKENKGRNFIESCKIEKHYS